MDNINARLQGDGFKERFDLVETQLSGKSSHKLSIVNETNKLRTIDILLNRDYDNDDIFEDNAPFNPHKQYVTVCYLNFEFKAYFGYNDFYCKVFNIGNFVKRIYKNVKSVLQNQTVILVYPCKENAHMSSKEILLPQPIDRINTQEITYRKKEKKLLDNPRYTFTAWSNELNESQKCYILGLWITKHPEIKSTLKDIEDEYAFGHGAEKILWKGKTTKSIIADEVSTMMIGMLVMLSLLCLFGFFGGWKLYVLLQIIAAGLIFALMPAYIMHYKRRRYIVTNLRMVNVLGSNMDAFTWYKDISQINITKKGIHIELKANRKGMLANFPNLQDKENVAKIISDCLNKITSAPTVYMQKLETQELQDKFFKACTVVQQVVDEWNPLTFSSSFYYLQAPNMEFGWDVIQIAEFLLTDPNKDALSEWITTVYRRFANVGYFAVSPSWAAEIILSRLHTPALGDAV